jgi:hypothetical protein
MAMALALIIIFLPIKELRSVSELTSITQQFVVLPVDDD